jgi:hypothetical protein
MTPIMEDTVHTIQEDSELNYSATLRTHNNELSISDRSKDILKRLTSNISMASSKDKKKT